MYSQMYTNNWRVFYLINNFYIISIHNKVLSNIEIIYTDKLLLINENNIM